MCRKVKRFPFRPCESDASVAALVSHSHRLQICLLAEVCRPQVSVFAKVAVHGIHLRAAVAAETEQRCPV